MMKKSISLSPSHWARVLMALAILVSSAVAQAQPLKEELPRQAPGWLLTPVVGLGGSWDDNLLLASEGDDALKDFGMPVESGATLDYRGRRLNVSGSYNGSFVMYQTYGDLNSADQRARFYVDHRPTARLRLFAEELYLRSPSTDALSISGVPFYRTGSQTNEAGGGLEAALARHTTLTAGYVLRAVAFEQIPGQQLQDGREHDVTVSLVHARSARLTLGARYEFRREVLSEGADRFNIQDGGATVAYTLTERLVVSGLAGVSVLGPGLAQDRSVGPALEAELLYRAGETRLSAAYRRTFVPSFGFGGTFQNQEWVGAVHIPLASRRVYVDGRIAWFDNEPIERGQPSLRSLWLSAATGYRVSRWLNLEGYADRSAQDSQRAGGNVKRNQIGFRAVVSKPLRLRQGF